MGISLGSLVKALGFGLGLRVLALRLRVVLQGVGFSVLGLGFRIEGLGCWVLGSRFKFWGLVLGLWLSV